MATSDHQCKTVQLEAKEYPSVIMGGDAFLDYWGEQGSVELGTAEGVLDVMTAAFEEGARGFDLSMNSHVLEAFRKLQEKVDGQAVGIANPNWRMPLMLRDTCLWDIRRRVVATILARRLSTCSRDVRHHAPGVWADWFSDAGDALPLSKSDVVAWQLDEVKYASRLRSYRGITDFCLVGSDYGDWCCALDRVDLLERMVGCVRRAGLIPLAITHWPSLSLPYLDHLDVAGHWVMVSMDRQAIFPDEFRTAVENTRKPVTAFQVLGHGRLVSQMREAFVFVEEAVRPASVVVGVCSPKQARESFSLLRGAIPRLWTVA